MSNQLLAALSLLSLFCFAPSVARADLPAGVRYDEAFAWFELDSRGSVSNNIASDGWSLEGNVRIVGPGIPEGSAFKLVLKQGRRELASATEPGMATTELVRYHPSNPNDAYSARFNRVGELDVSGVISVEVYFINDGDDSETLVHTHQLDVRRLTRLRSNGTEQPGEFFINRHGETPVMLIQRVVWRARPYLAGYGGRGRHEAGQNNVYLTASRSYAEANNIGSDLRLRCTVNGEHVGLPQDAVGVDGPQTREATSEIRASNNRTETEYVQFERFTWLLPLTFGSDDHVWNGHAKLEDHPGQWACSIRNGARNTLREFAFTVNTDGTIAPHPEEAHVSLLPGAHFVQTTIPGTDNPLDFRTDPSSRTFFYGRAWASPEGREMAGAVPTISEGFPPSARGRATRRRRR